MAKREPHLQVLANGQFRRLLGAEWASLIGDYALLPVIPFAVFQLGGSTTEVAAVFGAEYLALTLLVLFGGVAGDRLPRRSVMVVADLALTVPTTLKVLPSEEVYRVNLLWTLATGP